MAAPKRHRHRIGPRITPGLLLLAIVGILWFFGVTRDGARLVRLLMIKRTEERTLKTTLDEEQQLTEEIQRLTADSLYIEEIARREYGMIRPGEEQFRITVSDSSADSTRTRR